MDAASRATGPFDIEEVDMDEGPVPPPVQRLPSVSHRSEIGLSWPQTRISWADLTEQYDALFNKDHPDLEAQLMGIPPPPDDWIAPPRPFRARTMQASHFDVETGNRFSALQDAHGAWPPASARPLAPPPSPSTSRGVEPHPQTPSPRTSSKSPASAV